MFRNKLEELQEIIQKVHKSVEISQTTRDTSVILTLEYAPGYFNAERPFKDFLLWIEGLWRKGLADYHNAMRNQIRSSSRC